MTPEEFDIRIRGIFATLADLDSRNVLLDENLTNLRRLRRPYTHHHHQHRTHHHLLLPRP
jgi:hypothetical protein